MDKRFILAIVLIFIVLFTWPLIFNRKKTPPPPPPAEEQQQVVEDETPKDKAIEADQPEFSPQEISPTVSEDTVVTVETPLYQARLTTEGARVISWKLKEYMERNGNREEASEYMDLVPPTARNCLKMQFHDLEIQDEMYNARWSLSREEPVVQIEGDQGELEFTYNTSQGMAVSKKIMFFPDNYLMDLDISFYNPTSEEIELTGYDFYWGDGITKDELLTVAEVATEGPAAFVETEKGTKLIKHWKRTGFACFSGKQVLLPEQSGPISWLSFSSKYFVAVLIPGPEAWWSDSEKAGKRYKLDPSAEDIPVSDQSISPKEVWNKWGMSTSIGLVSPQFSIPAGQTVLHKYRIYLGPKKWDILRDIKDRGEPGEKLKLGKLINFGFFSPLGKATLWLLKVFYHVADNYGVAIILMTVLIKILYLPLTQKSFKSMQKMQKLQPKITNLRDKYRDDPQRLQKETMKLYKQHGVNPMGGCLPLLFQIPVFWALFATLRGAVELRGAMFISGWVTDLAQPDTVATVAGFPIRILPILMTGSMLAQQLLFGTSGGTGSSQSSKMMAFMPLIFAFIFYGMPSGLVLYWLCNNILAIGHQYFIRGKKNTESEEQEDKNKKNRNNRKQK
jgi:YidC/Oxa1 family membrane protein insertase